MLEKQEMLNKQKESMKQTKYNEILMQAMQTVANPQASAEDKAIAQKIIDMHRMNKLYSNPAAWQEEFDLSKLGEGIPVKPSVIQQAGSSTPKVSDNDLINKYLNK